MRDASRSKRAQKATRAPFQPSELYKIRVCRALSGEHLPLIVSAVSGLPLVRPNQFILVNRRDRCQVSTIKGDLGVLAVVLSWAGYTGVDLDELLDGGRGIDQVAVVSLVDALRTDYRHRRKAGNVVSLQRPLVSTAAWAKRIAIARDYIAWNLANVLSKCEPGTLRYQHVRERRDEFVRAMNGRMPKSRSTSNRRGLEEALKARLFAVVAVGAAENPFQAATQERNALIIDILHTLGLRRAELCKLRTAHFTPGPKPTLFVERRPDDPEDPRLDQPQVKTLSRLLPLDIRLASRIQRYILNDRKELPNARRSPFLFLARTGKPLAVSSVNNIFDQIVMWHPEFTGLLTPHVMRHTANDELSASFERAGCRPDLAKEIRNYLNGWEPTSSQGSRYNQTYVAAKAAEVSIAHQRRIFGREDV